MCQSLFLKMRFPMIRLTVIESPASIVYTGIKQKSAMFNDKSSKDTAIPVSSHQKEYAVNKTSIVVMMMTNNDGLKKVFLFFITYIY